MGKTFLFILSDSEIPCPPERVRELAARGLERDEIAKELGMSFTTFRRRLDNSSIQAAYEEGRREYAPTAKTRAQIGFDAEGVPYLTKHDRKVLKALKQQKVQREKFSLHKQVAALREITKFTDRQIIKSLERLEIHQMIKRYEYLNFTKFEAN